MKKIDPNAYHRRESDTEDFKHFRATFSAIAVFARQ
jgi:hypothetical protein